jgi:hypothetical protein
MIIRYSNGYQIEGVLVSRTDDSMRVAIQGSDDILHLNLIHGTWISEDCEPVQVDFAWKKEDGPMVTLDDCICSKELAAKLLHLLFSGDTDAEAEAAALAKSAAAPIYYQVV